MLSFSFFSFHFLNNVSLQGHVTDFLIELRWSTLHFNQGIDLKTFQSKRDQKQGHDDHGREEDGPQEADVAYFRQHLSKLGTSLC